MMRYGRKTMDRHAFVFDKCLRVTGSSCSTQCQEPHEFFGHLIIYGKKRSNIYPPIVHSTLFKPIFANSNWSKTFDYESEVIIDLYITTTRSCGDRVSQ
ncbi:hypothetical protein EGR_00405 [Echinococcus granulosus]|uniref:Uncharacterized protein n=1 Tax=Echinococcus granulosus TaxID=6210 RepID=W6UWS5_ECHGR|nr:hypothetical protein EGR_00405 [Echinococcus granulosus]EUB65136.1 hypothetical protein EGR_00405 [Echinococcus granulosus]